MLHKIRLERYDAVHLLPLTDKIRQKFKEANEVKCNNNPLMPAYSPEMEWICATKTHFTHACKLSDEGTHTLFNQKNTQKIRFRPDCQEGKEISQHGVMAVLYEPSIWDDLAEVHALNALGNFNASIEQEEDEMQAFGHVDTQIKVLRESGAWEKEESISNVVSSRRSNKKLCVSLRCKMSSRVGTSQVISVPSRTEAASMYHRLRTLRRRLRGGVQA